MRCANACEILQELKSQAAKILGSVDFLGNPLGLFSDVTEGISGLLNEGNVGGLIKNVAHGVSNSAAKVSSVDNCTTQKTEWSLQLPSQEPLQATVL